MMPLRHQYSQPLCTQSIHESKSGLLVHTYYILALALICTVEMMYRHPLYDYSVVFIRDVIQPFRSEGFTLIMETLSFFGEGTIYFVGFLLVLNWYSRGRAFYYLMFLSTLLTLQIAMKIGYHEPRPYMSDDQIIVIGCSHEYGNPSGHSLFSAGFSLLSFMDFMGKAPKTRGFFFALGGPIAFFLLMGFARVYQGVHTIDQVIYGW